MDWVVVLTMVVARLPTMAVMVVGIALAYRWRAWHPLASRLVFIALGGQLVLSFLTLGLGMERMRRFANGDRDLETLTYVEVGLSGVAVVFALVLLASVFAERRGVLQP